jgi:hypothetical protein
MLHSIRSVKKCSMFAADGDVGKLADAFFDDEHWVLRHLVVDTGNWLTRHEVLLSPLLISDADWENSRLHLRLPRSTIENSPLVHTHEPVSRQAEESLSRHYGLPYYWGGPHASGKQNFSDAQLRTIQRDIEQGSEEDRHLRSYNEVAGYAVAGRDDRVGHVTDFLFDDGDWSIQYLVVDPRDLWPGKHVLLPVSRVEGVLWSERKVLVDMSSEEIKNSQEYDPDHLPPSLGQQVHAPGGMHASDRPRI